MLTLYGIFCAHSGAGHRWQGAQRLVQLPERFKQAIDRCENRCQDADAYLAEWRKAVPHPVEVRPPKLLHWRQPTPDATYDTERLRSADQRRGQQAYHLWEACVAILAFP
jgi:hypothetical protein